MCEPYISVISLIEHDNGEAGDLNINLLDKILQLDRDTKDKNLDGFHFGDQFMTWTNSALYSLSPITSISPVEEEEYVKKDEERTDDKKTHEEKSHYEEMKDAIVPSKSFSKPRKPVDFPSNVWLPRSLFLSMSFGKKMVVLTKQRRSSSWQTFDNMGVCDVLCSYHTHHVFVCPTDSYENQIPVHRFSLVLVHGSDEFRIPHAIRFIDEPDHSRLAISRTKFFHGVMFTIRFCVTSHRYNYSRFRLCVVDNATGTPHYASALFTIRAHAKPKKTLP